MKSSRLRIMAGGVLLMALFAGCTAGANPQEFAAAAEPAGFLLGLWHGFISLFAFIASLFFDDVGVYEVVNNGAWYNFGFVLGAMSFYGGGGGGASRSGRRR